MSLGIEVFEMKFSCSITWKKGETESWDGVIDKILDYGGLYEIFIKSRSSIQVFIGRSSRGIFACISTFVRAVIYPALMIYFTIQKTLSRL